MGEGAKGPDALARVLRGTLSKGIDAMPHFMRFCSAAHPAALSNLGRDALPSSLRFAAASPRVP